MLPRIHRIKKSDFERLKSLKKQRFFSENTAISVYKTKRKNEAMFAVVVSSSLLKKSTERNKLKRRIKAIILKKIPFFKKGLLVIIYPKKGIFGKNFADIREELINLFCKTGIIDQC